MKRLRIILIVITVVCVAAVAAGFTGAQSDMCLVVKLDGEDVLNGAYTLDLTALIKVIFRYGNNFQRYYEHRFLGNPLSCIESLNSELAADIENLAESVKVEKREPSAEFSDGKFTYFEGVVGKELDVDELCLNILNNISLQVEAQAKIIVEPPEGSVDKLLADTMKMAEFYTGFSTSGDNRKHNIALAAAKLNNIIIQPDEKLSFNTVVGERTAENGFLEAKIISNGEFVPGVGGGVCQVSTTLFNCWLKAGLTFESAAAHSLPVSYVKPSLDAMVSSATDLVLINNSEKPVYIYARCANDRLYISVYGKPCGYEVRLWSATLSTIEAPYILEYGELDWTEEETERIIKPAVNGVVSESYRDFYSNGVLIKTEKLRKNIYKPQQGLKIVRKDNTEAVA